MYCDSCSAVLPEGTILCPWCNTPTARPQPSPPFAPPQFPATASQSGLFQSPKSQQPSQRITHKRPVQRVHRQQHVNLVDKSNHRQEPEKQRSIGSLIFPILIVLIIIALLLVGAYFTREEMHAIHKTAKTVTRQLDNPTGLSINATAATILSHAQSASKIDNTLAPVQLTNTFTTGQHVYITFHIDSKGQDGTIQARWYADGQQVSTSMFHHTHENMQGLVSYAYLVPAKVGVVALFWCLQKDCSDAQLATIVHFTILVGSGPVVNVQSSNMTPADNRKSRRGVIL